MLSKSIEPVLYSIRRFCGDQRGVSAIEFALVVPILLIMYIGAMELGQAIETNKKLGRMASTIADLITQERQSIPGGKLTSFMKLGETIVLPYQRSEHSVVVAAIEFNNDAPPVGNVVWRGAELGEDATCPEIEIENVPATLKTPGSFIVGVQTCLPYKSVIDWNGTVMSKIGFTSTSAPTISMTKVSYFRPRMDERLTCTGTGCLPG